MRKHSKTMSMGLMPATYLVQLETFISPGLPYLSLIGLHDEDRRIRNRIRAACKAVGYELPACRTTVNLMPTGTPKLPGLCVLACAVSILAADGRIPSADQLEDTIILGDVNEDGTIPPIDADLAELIAYAAHRLEIHRIIIPSANLAGTPIPTGVVDCGLGRIDELLTRCRRLRITPGRTPVISGGPPPLPIGRIHGRHAWIESTHAKMVLNMV